MIQDLPLGRSVRLTSEMFCAFFYFSAPTARVLRVPRRLLRVLRRIDVAPFIVRAEKALQLFTIICRGARPPITRNAKPSHCKRVKTLQDARHETK